MKKSRQGYVIPVAIIVCVVSVIVGLNFYLSSITPEPFVQKTSLENGEAVSGLGANPAPTDEKRDYFTLDEKKRMFPTAPELQGIAGYINSDDPVSIAKLKDEGKVVLVDFWTYSCINCQRTTPYLNSWYEKYEKDGLVIIGVHTPEFGFEKDYNNVRNAVEKFGIKYPVVQDNDYSTWKAYGNRYWPRKYIVDIDGFVRYDHIGEGAYEETEKVIQDLLRERSDRLGLKTEMNETISNPVVQEVVFGRVNTPEIYFGYNFARQNLGNKEGFQPEKDQTYTLPDPRSWSQSVPYLGGTWHGSSDSIDLRGVSGEVGLKYSAKSANIVAGGKGNVTVYVDGEKIGGTTIEGDTLYNVVSSESYGTRSLRLVFAGNVSMYTFTFG